MRVFFKLVASGPGSGGAWASPLGKTVSSPVAGGVLGTAGPTLWAPGSYAIRPVVVDSRGDEAAAWSSSLQFVAP